MTSARRRVPELVVVGPSRGPAVIDPKYTVIVGTSGSADYLHDAAGSQRFWPVGVQGVQGVAASDDGQICDGLHDENAPSQYLCSSCFPKLRGDLSEPLDDESDEVRRDEYEEME